MICFEFDVFEQMSTEPDFLAGSHKSYAPQSEINTTIDWFLTS
jgi:hypothetical protein